MKSIKLLRKYANSSGPGFLRTLEKVHEQQKILLATIFLLFNELDESLRSHKEYRISLPPQDRSELENTYSENILFAAEALSGGFRIRGIEGFTDELVEPAKTLCATLQALRASLRIRCSKSIYPPYFDIFDILSEFDAAWTNFESQICSFYQLSNGRLLRINEKLQFLQVQ